MAISGTEASELDALRRGDETAFVAALQRYHAPLMRLAMTYVHSRDAAEDVVQEAWLTAIRSLDRFESRSSLKTWISGIVINLARARHRRESRLIAFTSMLGEIGDARRPTVDRSRFGPDGAWRKPPSSWDNLPEATFLRQETLGRIKAAIEDLPPRHREVMVLRDIVQLDAGQVQAMLGISAENERVRLHRARAAVRKALEEYLA